MNSPANKSGSFRKFSAAFAVFKIRARGGLITATLLVLLTSVCARADLSIYSDSLQPNWYDWTQLGGADFNNSTPIHSGLKSIAVLDSWTFFMIGSYPALDLTGFASLDFSFHGGAQVHSNAYLGLMFTGPAIPSETTTFYLPALPPDVWHDISIPLTAPAFANRSDFIGFFIGNYNSDHAPYYVDDIRLTSVPEPSGLGLLGMGWLIFARRFKRAKY